MRVLCVMHLADAVGPPQHVQPWLAALRAHATMEVVVPRAGSVADLYAPLGQVTVLPYAPLTLPRGTRATAAFPMRFVREARMFRAHVRKTRPDLVVTVTATLPAALLGARSAGVPTLVYAAEIFGRAGGNARGLLARLLTAATRLLATEIVASSEAVAAQYRPATSSIAYPGVVPPEKSGDRDAFRRRHGLDDADPCLAVVGNISFGRGQDIVVRALGLLAEDFPSAALVVAGGTLGRAVDEDYLVSLRRLAADLGVADRVRFTGFVREVQDVYAAADVVINPARVPEGFGRVALEALVADRPIVSARVGAVPEVLRDGVDALLVEPGAPECFASAVTRLWRDKSFLRSLVRSGRARALERFSEAQGTASFCDVVTGMLASASDTRRDGR